MRSVTFGAGTAATVPGDVVAILGGKGAGLVRMDALGLPVPPGFVLPVASCDVLRRAASEGALPAALDALWPSIEQGIDFIEDSTGLRLGDPERPLLLAVRAGAPVSQPGVLATVLNVGLNAATLPGLAARLGAVGAADCAWRLVVQYAEAVHGAEPGRLSEVRAAALAAAAVERVVDLPREAIVALLRHGPDEAAPAAPPADPRAQLRGAIEGVLASWSARRAVRFRRRLGLADEPGLAVTVQAMVFGNGDHGPGVVASAGPGAGPDWGTGVIFSRDPNTGAPGPVGEFLAGSQGPDLVGGSCTPQPLGLAPAPDAATPDPEAAPDPEVAPDAEAAPDTQAAPDPEAALAPWRVALAAAVQRLEASWGDLLEVEFTVEAGQLWLLQCRPAARSATASVRAAVALAEAGTIDRAEALRQVEPERLSRLLNASVDLGTGGHLLARGLPASPGAVYGALVFDAAEAVRRGAAGESVILVLPEASAEDLEGFRAAVGVLTARGGMTSHAALMARGLGRCCVTGCGGLAVDAAAGRMTVRADGRVLNAGAVVTLDGTTGDVYLGAVATRPADPPAALPVLLGWADGARRLAVSVSADDLAEAQRGLEAGADGVGLWRTERLFLAPDHLALARALVLAVDPADRQRAVEALAPLHRAEFAQLFERAADRAEVRGRPCPVAVRLLDLPLDDLITDDREALAAVAARLDVSSRGLVDRVRALRARNPQMGLRGCRVGLSFPEVYAVQVQALFEAACAQTAAFEIGGLHPTPVPLEIVLPLVTSAAEVAALRARIDGVAQAVATRRGRPPVRYRLGAMIESPRACLVAGELAAVADHFLFGTNDLTSATFCVHRDDAARFLPQYVEQGLLPHDPFVTLDEAAVVRLIALAVAEGRARRPGLRCGLSGAQANAPQTVALAHRLGLDEVSVAAHRVPIARLAAARAAVGERIL